ncbi:MAG: RNA methyltransferase, partial [SAR324 cluster bacterium]|nr:RNA methyltransferase [SAR324 cluster bacterium]
MKTAPQRRVNSWKHQQEDQLEWLYGTHSVLAALRHKRRKLVGLHLKDSGQGRLQALVEAAKKSGVPIHYEASRWFSDNLGESVHQGVALQCGPLSLLDEAELPPPNSGKPNLVFVLDGVEDPHNLGAIVRTLGFFGVSAVAIPKDRAAALSPVAAKASVGALEWFSVVRVTNLHRFLERQK